MGSPGSSGAFDLPALCPDPSTQISSFCATAFLDWMGALLPTQRSKSPTMLKPPGFRLRLLTCFVVLATACRRSPVDRGSSEPVSQAVVVEAGNVRQFFSDSSMDWSYHCSEGQGWIVGPRARRGVLPIWVVSPGGRFAWSAWADHGAIIETSSGREAYRPRSAVRSGPNLVSFDHRGEFAAVAGPGYVDQVDLQRGLSERIYGDGKGVDSLVVSHDGLGRPVVAVENCRISDHVYKPCDVVPHLGGDVSFAPGCEGPIFVREHAGAWVSVDRFERLGVASLVRRARRWTLSSNGRNLADEEAVGCRPQLLGALHGGESAVVACGDRVQVWPSGALLTVGPTLAPWTVVPGARPEGVWQALLNNTLLDAESGRIVKVDDSVSVLDADVWWLVSSVEGLWAKFELFEPSRGHRRLVSRVSTGWAEAGPWPRLLRSGRFAIVGSSLADLKSGNVSRLDGPAVGVSRSSLFTAFGREELPPSGMDEGFATEIFLGPIVARPLP